MRRRAFLAALAGLPFLPTTLSALPAPVLVHGYRSYYFVQPGMYARIVLTGTEWKPAKGAFVDAMIQEFTFVARDMMEREERELHA